MSKFYMLFAFRLNFCLDVLDNSVSLVDVEGMSVPGSWCKLTNKPMFTSPTDPVRLGPLLNKFCKLFPLRACSASCEYSAVSVFFPTRNQTQLLVTRLSSVQSITKIRMLIKVCVLFICTCKYQPQYKTLDIG
jgi:hypothetical protein